MYFEPQVGVNCVVHSLNMAMGKRILTAEQLMDHCRELTQGTNLTHLYTPGIGFSTSALCSWMVRHGGWQAGANGQEPLILQTYTRSLRTTRATGENTTTLQNKPTRQNVTNCLPHNEDSFIIHLHTGGIHHAACIKKSPINPLHWILLDSALSGPVNLDQPGAAPPGLYTQEWTSYPAARRERRTPTWGDLQVHVYSIKPRTMELAQPPQTERTAPPPPDLPNHTEDRMDMDQGEDAMDLATEGTPPTVYASNGKGHTEMKTDGIQQKVLVKETALPTHPTKNKRGREARTPPKVPKKKQPTCITATHLIDRDGKRPLEPPPLLHNEKPQKKDSLPYGKPSPKLQWQRKETGSPGYLPLRRPHALKQHHPPPA